MRSLRFAMLTTLAALAAPFALAEPAPEPAGPAREATPSAWLGVELAEVPLPLAVHLDLKTQGVMVGNVFADSPADQAGLEQFDVIIEADGKPVADKVARFSRLIRGKKPGQTLNLRVCRTGKTRNVGLQLAQRPADLENLKSKYAPWPETRWDLRGRILRRGPDGGYILEDLGPMPKLRDVPKGLDPLIQRFFREKEATHACRIDKQGRVLSVRQEEDGSIVVERHPRIAGPEEGKTKTYPNLDALRDADPEAYRLLESARQRRDTPRRGAAPQPWSEQFRRNYDEALKKWTEQQEKYEGYLKNWREHLDEYEATLDQWRNEMKEELGKHPSPQWREWYRGFAGDPENKALAPTTAPAPNDKAAAPSASPPPAVRFEYAPDGSITAHLREGDTELSWTFASEADLREKAPRLHERYTEMQKRIR